MMNVSALPAVKDANAPGGVFHKAVGRETGMGGATPSGCFRSLLIIVLSLAAGVILGLQPFGAGLFASAVSHENETLSQLYLELGAWAGLIVFGLVVWGVYTFLSRLIHPNVHQAKQILKTGMIPLDKIGPVLQAREPSLAERQRFDDAASHLMAQGQLFFDGWFVLPASHPYALTFGSYLFLSRGAIEGKELDKVIAHELGHLNNGDSFVKCALWALGKGWAREYMALSGTLPKSEGDKQVDIVGVGTIGYALVRRYWEVAIAEATLMSIIATGSSLKGMEEDLRFYFWKWDVEADGVAEPLVGVSIYQKYLKDLANFEKGLGTLPLSAPAELRYDRSLVRLSVP